jgi:hypothetical protein
MRFKIPHFFIIILGASVATSLVLGFSSLKEKWEPRITYIDTLPVDPGKTEFTFGGGGYLNERCEYYYLIYTSWSAKGFQIVIERFSEELQVLVGNKRVEAAPYVLQEGKLPEERCIWLSFTVIMPNQTGTYELQLHTSLFNLLSSREYKWRYSFEVRAFVPKPSPEEPLTITLDKEAYHQGENITITITNNSNETISFSNSAYDLHFDIWNGDAWELYDAIPSNEVIVYLQKGEQVHITWKLGGHIERPFQAGHYRVGTKGIYTEFMIKP